MESNVSMRWESKAIEAIQVGDNRIYRDKGGIIQVPEVGIVEVKAINHNNSREVTWKFKKMTNFIINDLEVIDLDGESKVVKFNVKNDRDRVKVIEGSLNMFNSPKSFRNALNSMHFIFWGSTSDLQRLKVCLIETL